MAKYLVTGAAGFIGSHIAAALASQGDGVRCIDNLATGNRVNLEAISGDVEFIEADINDADAIRGACRGIEIVFHEAAIPSVPKSVIDPLSSHQANINGTMSLLLACKEAKVRRVVYAASSSAYGETPTLPKREDMLPAPISPYAVQKYCGELYLSSFTRVYGLETVSLRYFNVFGPRQDPTSQYSGVLAKFITAMLDGKSPVVYGNGEQSRDFTYIDNVVRGNLLAASAPAAAVSGRMFNLATSRRITLNEVIAILRKLTGYTGDVQYASERTGDIKHSLADISAARQALGYEPQVAFEEGLARTVEWYRSAQQRNVVNAR